MKRIWTIFLVVLLAMPAFTTRADKVEIIGDTLVAVSGSDTVRLSGAAEIQKYIARMLDDTVLQVKEGGDSLAAEVDSKDREFIEAATDHDLHKMWSDTARDINGAFLCTLLAIIFVSLSAPSPQIQDGGESHREQLHAARRSFRHNEPHHADHHHAAGARGPTACGGHAD